MKAEAINKRIGEELRMIRLSKNLSQEAVADELNISVSTLSNLERGQTEFTVSRLYEILFLLNITIFDFLKRIHKESFHDNTTIKEEALLYYSKTEQLEKEIRQIKAVLEQLKNK